MEEIYGPKTMMRTKERHSHLLYQLLPKNLFNCKGLIVQFRILVIFNNVLDVHNIQLFTQQDI